MSLEFLISKIQKNKFLLIGRAGIDIYPDPPGTKTENAKNFVTHLGGSSANMGVELTKLGGNCSLLTKVSDDALGRLAINQLDSYGVKRDLVKFEKNETRISFAIVESTINDHQSIIYRHKASDLFLSKIDIENSSLVDFECILITGTSLAAEPSRSATLYALDIANSVGKKSSTPSNTFATLPQKPVEIIILLFSNFPTKGCPTVPKRAPEFSPFLLTANEENVVCLRMVSCGNVVEMNSAKYRTSLVLSFINFLSLILIIINIALVNIAHNCVKIL